MIIDISTKEVPIKLVTHTLLLIIPAISGLWNMYLLQILFFSPFVILSTLDDYKIYKGKHTYHEYNNIFDFAFEILLPHIRFTLMCG